MECWDWWEGLSLSHLVSWPPAHTRQDLIEEVGKQGSLRSRAVGPREHGMVSMKAADQGPREGFKPLLEHI